MPPARAEAPEPEALEQRLAAVEEIARSELPSASSLKAAPAVEDEYALGATRSSTGYPSAVSAITPPPG